MEKSIQKDTNWTTIESDRSGESKLSIKEGPHSLTKKKLLFKSINSTPKYASKIISVFSTKSSTPNQFVKQSTGSLSKESKISRRFISLIDDEEKELGKQIIEVKAHQNKGLIQRHSEFSKQLSKLEPVNKLNLRKTNYSQLVPKEDELGEENMVESPCPRPRVPGIKSYRKADEKSESTFEFKISPWFINEEENSNSKNDSSSEERLFDREDTMSSGEYELFTWWDEFSDIINSNDKDIYQINLQNKQEIDWKRKYLLLKEYMNFKTSLIRNVHERQIRDIIEEKDPFDFKSKETHRKRRSVAYANFKLENQITKSTKAIGSINDDNIIIVSEAIMNTETEWFERTMRSPLK